MGSEFKVLLNSKVIKIDGIDIYFDNGYVMTVHPYETYLEKVK
jgi:hypothetical protein